MSPSRFTLARKASFFLSAAMALPAWYSSQKPTTALPNNSTSMMPKSAQWPTAADKNRRDLDHPGNRPPEVREKFQQGIDVLLGNLIVAVLAQAALRLRGIQTRGRSSKLLPQLRKRQSR